jgi:O-antigen/teichoic acid export membrane protein
VTSLSTRDPELSVASDNDDEKRLKRQRMRSLAIAFGLGFLVLLFYAATIVRMGK